MWSNFSQRSGLHLVAAWHATCAETTDNGFRFVVEGLDYATVYAYAITANDADGNTLQSYTGTFTTTRPMGSGTDSVIRSTPSQSATRKVFRNGQVYILRGDKTYTADGRDLGN